MNTQDRKGHWEAVYQSKGEQEVSWYQETPTSLSLLATEGVTTGSAIIDVGGGISRLVDLLIARGYRDVSVLDVSGAALATAKERLKSQSDSVSWIEADITQWSPSRRYDVWHDRAVLHFLTTETEQKAYRQALTSAMSPGGLVIIGTFALDGPDKCSGLPVQRYSGDTLAEMLGNGFERIDTSHEEHATPWQAKQKFQFSRFILRP